MLEELNVQRKNRDYRMILLNDRWSVMKKYDKRIVIYLDKNSELDQHCINILANIKKGQYNNFIKMAIYNYGRNRIAGLEDRSSTIFPGDEIIE